MLDTMNLVRFFIFAGNFITGKMIYGGEIEDISDNIDRRVDDLSDKLGRGKGFVWGRYESSFPFDMCERDFREYLEYRRELHDLTEEQIVIEVLSA